MIINSFYSKHQSLIYLIILMVLIIPAIWLMISSSLYDGYDVLYHIKRIEEFHLAILEGQFPPRLAPSLIYGSTYPLFVVNHQFPYLFAEIFMLISHNSTVAFKSVMTISYILSAVFFYFFSRNIFGSLGALGATVVWSYLPYRFAQLYFRASIAETVATMFVPLILLGLLLTKSGSKWGLPLLSIAVFGILSSHPAYLIILGPFLIIFTIFILKPNRNALLKMILGLILGLALSASSSFPSVFEKKYMKFDLNLEMIYASQFVDPFQLFRIPKTGINLGTHLQAGIVSLVIIFFGLINVIGKKI